jgi:acetyl esterase/lipase
VALVPGFEDGAHTEVSSMPNALALFNPAVVLSPVEGHPGLLSEEKVADIRARTDGRPQEISPYHFVRAGLPPSILFHGTNDEAVPFPTVELFAKAMTVAGNRFELKAYEGQPHGFFNPGRGKGETREEPLDAPPHHSRAGRVLRVAWLSQAVHQTASARRYLWLEWVFAQPPGGEGVRKLSHPVQKLTQAA